MSVAQQMEFRVMDCDRFFICHVQKLRQLSVSNDMLCDLRL